MAYHTGVVQEGTMEGTSSFLGPLVSWCRGPMQPPLSRLCGRIWRGDADGEGKGKRPSGTSSAEGREATAACGGERRRADVGSGRWEMGGAATGAMPRRGSVAEAGSEIGMEKETAVGKEAS